MQGKYFQELDCGDEFFFEMTITETHLVLFAGLTGDFNPVQTNQRYCEGTNFKKRVLHGAFTSSFLAAPIGQFFYGTGVALLELNTSFKKPVFPGNTLLASWKIEKLSEKTDCGLVEVACTCKNESDVVVATATAKVLVQKK